MTRCTIRIMSAHITHHTHVAATCFARLGTLFKATTWTHFPTTGGGTHGAAQRSWRSASVLLHQPHDGLLPRRVGEGVLALRLHCAVTVSSMRPCCVRYRIHMKGAAVTNGLRAVGRLLRGAYSVCFTRARSLLPRHAVVYYPTAPAPTPGRDATGAVWGRAQGHVGPCPMSRGTHTV